MNKYVERLYNGVIKENPTFVLMLGMCPTLAVTSSAINGLGMGLSTLVVLVFSNLLISLFRKVIPNGVRMPAYIVIVASLVTVVQFLMQAYLPSLSNALGVYIPLIGEILGAGTFFGLPFLSAVKGFTPITIFIMAPGAFLVLAFLVAGMNIIRKKMEAKGKPLAEPAGCLSGDCAHCGQSALCTGKSAASSDNKQA